MAWAGCRGAEAKRHGSREISNIAGEVYCKEFEFCNE